LAVVLQRALSQLMISSNTFSMFSSGSSLEGWHDRGPARIGRRSPSPQGPPLHQHCPSSTSTSPIRRRRLGATVLPSPSLLQSYPTPTQPNIPLPPCGSVDAMVSPCGAMARGAPAAAWAACCPWSHVGPSYSGLARHQIGPWARAWVVAAACGLP
jgi:hypothetical protein